MHFNLAPLLSISLALATLAVASNHRFKMMNETAMGHAVITNQCQMPLYLWSVGESVNPQTVIQSGQSYSEEYRRDQKTGGVAIKITTVMDGLYNSAPQTVLAYNLVGDMVWYGLSDVFGDPFMGEAVSLMPSEPAIRWEEGIPPRGSQVLMQDSSMDLVLTIC